MNIGHAVRAGRWKKKKGHDRKKSQKGYISPILGEAPIEAIYIKSCVVDDLVHIITCAKFHVELSGVMILQGVEFFIFPLIFEWTLQQCSATALPVI